MAVPRRASLLFLSLVLLCLGLFLLDLGRGSVSIPPGSVLSILGGGKAEQPGWREIVLLFRLPKALTALLAGSALAVSGLLLQTLFSNPLAGPDVLGTNAGASIGVAAWILLGGASGSAGGFLSGLGAAGSLGLVLSATAGALASLLLILATARRASSGTAVLIAGLLIGFMANALVSILVYFALPQKVGLYLAWTFGSFQANRMEDLPPFFLIAALGALLSFLLSKPLDALMLGEAQARSLGVRMRSLRPSVILAAALLSGAVTAYCGPIAFLGIAAPHAARGVFRTASHRLLIPATALCGAAFALAADICTQLPPSGALLPLNPLLALIGAPLILAIVLRPQGRALP